MSATEASRRFSELLDLIETEGETVVVERHGRAVAVLRPVPRATGAVLEELRRQYPPDPDWADEVRALRKWVGTYP
jgi:antitoxin (DNA-binding transcriptional repressor) of toxin-antitoxin stability system